MRGKIRQAVATAACLCLVAGVAYARARESGEISAGHTAEARAAGSVCGVVRDPTGAVVAGAKIELKRVGAGSAWSRATNREGRFDFEGVTSGIYEATVTVSGFQVAVIGNVQVNAGREAVVNVTLRIAPAQAEIEVREQNETAAATRRMVDTREKVRRSLAELAADAPGASLRENGALAGAPALHGLADERAKVVVNGTTEENSCPNHMNPQLSQAPAKAAAVTVLPGITPVSLGGDSLGGTVVVEGRTPVFASAQERAFEEGNATGFYRSNGREYGGTVTEWAATRHAGIGYTGTWRTNDDYTDGNGHRVTSTYAQSTEHAVTLAAQDAGNLVTVEAALDHTPYEGFVNARMDMVRDYSERVNAQYHRATERSAVEAQVFWRGTWHSMNVGRDKLTFPAPMWMPMNTHGREMGYALKLEVPLGTLHTLRAGNELLRFRLDDTWPPVAGTAPQMAPDTFVSIHDGRRVRLGTYVEAVSRWNASWTTLVGVRNDTVWTNAGTVEGYSSMYATDAAAFNAATRAHRDADMDATAQARWVPNAGWTVEFGYARKSRAPSLYERYAWSTNWMASGMIGWFGDGNYYVGNVALQPETAHTVSGTARWSSRSDRDWEIKVTPYVTCIDDFVDVDTLATRVSGKSTFAQLKFANHDARIYGGDFAGSASLWQRGRLGEGRVSAVAGWLHGERTDSSTPLYQMMPLNLRVNFDEEAGGFAGGVGAEFVDRKRDVDPHRFEQQTPGYALFNLHASYQRGALEVSCAAENLLNRAYSLPLGGVNMDDFMAGGKTGAIEPVTGRGRSAFFSLSARF